MGLFDRFRKNKNNEDDFSSENGHNEKVENEETSYTENETRDEQQNQNEGEKPLNEGDFESEGDSNATISRNKGISKNMIIMASLCAVGAIILFGARMLFNGGKLQKDPQTPTDTNKIDVADDQPIGIEDANGNTGDLLNEAEKQQQEQDATSTDTSTATEDGGVSEEEFRKSLEQSDTAGNEWDSVGSSPESFGGSSGSNDLSEVGGKLSAEDIRAAEEAEKKKKRDDKLAQARAGGMSFMSNNQAADNTNNGTAGNNSGTITASNGRVDPNQVPAGTYSVAPDGTVTQVSGGGNGGGQGANPQQQNTDPFRQTNPAITGRGAAGYGSVNTNSGNLTSQNSKYVLSAGQIIPATLLSGIRTITSDMAIAVVSSDVYDTRSGKHLLIPRGSKILGEYTPYIDGANFRVITIWNRIIFPNGDSLNLAQFKGVDLQGFGGMKSQVNTHFWKKLGNVVMSTLTAVAYNFADRLTIENGKVKLSKYQIKDENGQNTTDNPTTLGEVIQQIQNEAQNKNSQIQTVLTVKSGTRFNIRVNSDIILDSAYKPYYK